MNYEVFLALENSFTLEIYGHVAWVVCVHEVFFPNFVHPVI